MREPRERCTIFQRREAEFGASRGDRFDYAGHVVADKAKARNASVSLHNPPKGTLSILGHRISFIENNNLVGWAWVHFPIGSRASCGSRCLTSKVFNLISDYRDTSFIRRVKFQDAMSE